MMYMSPGLVCINKLFYKNIQLFPSKKCVISFVLMCSYSVWSLAQINNPHGNWRGGQVQQSGQAITVQGPICTDGSVTTVASSAKNIFFSGWFSNVGRCSGMGIPLKTSDGKPNGDLDQISQVSGQIFASVSDGAGGWYIGGTFDSVGGLIRTGVAHVDSNFMVDVVFNPVLAPLGYGSPAIYSLYYDGISLYIGGEFGYVNGDIRYNLTSVNPVTGATNAWNPMVDKRVYTLEADASNVYAGGSFQSSKTFPGGGAALDATTGLADFNFPYIQYVNDAIPDGAGGYYVAGQFETVAGLPRKGMVRLNSDGSVNSSFIADVDGNISQLMLWNGQLYIAGDFYAVNGSLQVGLASVDPATGTLNAFDPVIGSYLGENGSWGYGVKVFTQDGTDLYLGGNFSAVGGTKAISLASIDKTTGAGDSAFPSADGPIETIVDDGSGGWFVGGKFKKIGGVARTSVAHILSDKTVDPDWNPEIIGDYASQPTILKILVTGGSVFFSGQFKSVNGDSRSNLASVDAVTGSTNAFQADLTGEIKDMILYSGDLIVAGTFQMINSTVRKNLASLNTTTGSVNSWNPPGPDQSFETYYSVAISGTTIYVGGYFGTAIGGSDIGGNVRTGLVAFDLTTGAVTSWAPTVDGTIFKILISGTNVYLAGEYFSLVNATTRRGLAAVSLTTGATQAWNPVVTEQVKYMYDNGTTVIVGGKFSSVAGTVRLNLAEVNLTTGAVTAWNPKTSGRVNTLFVDASNVYVGGEFTSVGGTTRYGLAKIDTSGNLLAWNPATSTDSVRYSAMYRAMVYYSGRIIVGGFQTSIIAGATRNSMASIDSSSGAVQAFNPISGYSSVTGLAVDGSILYVGGYFTSFAGQAKSNFAAYDFSLPGIASFSPDSNGSVSDMEIVGSNIYVAGGFDSIGGQNLTGFAVLDKTTGVATAWDAHSDGGYPTAIVPSGSQIFVGGQMQYSGGLDRQKIAAFDKITGEATVWNPSADGDVRSIVKSVSSFFVGGEFSTIGGVSRNNLAEIDAAGFATAWNPNMDAGVFSVALSGGLVYAGGDFANVGGQSRSKLAAIPSTGVATATAWNPNLDGIVYAVAVDGTDIFAGGSFSLVGSKLAINGAMISSTTALAYDGFTKFGGPVYSTTVSGNQVFFGGEFSFINGQSRSNLASMDLNGDLTNWTPEPDGQVTAMAVYGNTLYLGGSFTTIAGVARNLAAAIDLNSGAVTAWDPNPDGWDITTIYPTATAVYISGSFNNIGGIARDYFASVNPTTGLGNSGFDASAESPPAIIIDNGSTIFVGGEFLNLGGQARKNIAELNSTTGLATAFSTTFDSYANVRSMALSGSTLYIGGYFTSVGGQVRTHIAAIDTTTGLATAWNPLGADDPYGMGTVVLDLKLLNGSIYAVGYFLNLGGQPRSGLVELDLTTGLATGWNPDLNSSPASNMTIVGNSLYMGGWFSRVGSRFRGGFAAIDLTTGQAN
jgi:hypothetical protein